MDFLKFISSKDQQKSNALATSNSPVLEELYSDPDLTKKFPFMPTQLKSIQGAKPRPKAVEYGDVTLAIQDCCVWCPPGSDDPYAALQELQTKLQTLIK